MKRLVIALWFAVIPSVALCQGTQTLEDTLRQVSKDLANLHQEVQIAYQRQVASQFLTGGIAPMGYSVTITKDQSPIRAGADNDASILTKVQQGTSFKVVDKIGDWYAITLDKPTKGLQTGWVRAAAASPQINPPDWKSMDSSSDKSLSNRIYEQITASVTAIREKYKNNPYVSVTGFTVNVTIPPSVTVSFAFK